jgi:Tol biopolymer transport system component
VGCGWATLLAEHDLLIHTNYHEIDDLVSSYFVLISSPDGQQIAFASAEGDHPNIYVIRAEGGRPRRLTAETSNDVWPSWSRDGQWIYFGSDRGGNWQVWKTPAEGGQAVQVTRKGGMEAFDSSDGKFVYYAKQNGMLGIWKIPAEGGEEVRILDQGSTGTWGVAEKGIYFADPETKPGPTIHFFSFAGRQLRQIATVEKRLLPGPGVFAVSSDGQWIVYTQFDRNESDIWLIKEFR